MAELTLKDVGPIEKLAIAVPTGGGVVVLRGRNGTGKTTALRGVEALVRGSGKVETRDAAKGSGRVDGFGATLILGRKVTRAGEVEVESLEGRLNIADLVDPPLKDPGAADRQRIKALVSLTGVEPTPAMFAEVIGAELAEHVNPSTWAGADLLDVAAKAKRDLEANARLKETEAATRDGQAKACEESAKDVDLSEPDDEQALRAAHLDASGDLRALQERQRAAAAAASAIAKARQRLAAVHDEYDGPTVKDAERELQEQQGFVDAAAQTVKQLSERLADAKRNLSDVEHARDRADYALDAASIHFATVAECESIISSTAADGPQQTELDDAATAVTVAAQAVEAGALIRRAKAELDRAKAYRGQASDAAGLADRLRVAAGQIDQVLSNAIKTPTLFVRDGRLWTNDHPRGEVLFHELSEGERWRMAFDIAAPVVGEHGILVLPQGAWEGLDPHAREHVAGLARKSGVIVLTAEATDGELRAEAFGAEGGAE